jgi:AcrR family transcriptional regulator
VDEEEFEMIMGSLSTEQQRMVMDSVLQLITTTKLGDITLEQLARASGVSAFDIVRHYQSKENILSAVLERELEMISGAVPSPELRFPSETLQDELQVLARVMLQEYRARMKFMGNLMIEAIQNPEVGVLFYRKFIQQGRLLFAEFLKVRRDRGELRDGVDIEAAAAMFISSLSGILIAVELFNGKQVEPLDEDRLVSELTGLFLNGIAK